MQLHKVLSIGILAAGGLVLANVTTDVSGDPAYTSALGQLLDGTPWYPHTDEWAAIWFTRDPGCVPPDFDLLTATDFTPAFPGGPPRPFLCTSTVSGFAIWKNGPPLDFLPLEAHEHGLGAVPVWFVRISEIQAATADNKLTITELLAMPSLRKGLASQFELACIFTPNSELTFRHGPDGSRLTKGDVKGSAVPPGYGRSLITEAGSDQERIVGTLG